MQGGGRRFDSGRLHSRDEVVTRETTIVTDESRLHFVRQQGLRGASPSACSLAYPALMFQPRVVGGLFLLAVVLQSAWCFAALGTVLVWSALLPRLNPFDALYNSLVGHRSDRAELGPAPSPRRFAQGLAGTLMIGAAVALTSGNAALAWILEALLAAAIAALVFGRFCLGSFLYLLLTDDGAFARRTLPWSSGSGD